MKQVAPAFRKKDVDIMAKVLKHSYKILYISREGIFKHVGYDIRGADPDYICAEVIYCKEPGRAEFVADIKYHKIDPIYGTCCFTNFEFGGF